ncbi:MAG: amidohydrolase [Acidimicrobiia bacterium]
MTTAFTNGRILTMDPHHPNPNVVVIDGDRIAAVGERALLNSYPHATTIDLGGRTLTPGFIDAHHHLCQAALRPAWGDCSGATKDAVLEALRAHARAEPDVHWLRGHQWNGPDITRHDLDTIADDRPIVLAHYSFHQCAVNSAALDLLGIGRSTPDPQGGEIVRDNNGAPTGVLIERAWSWAHAKSMEAYEDPDRWDDYVVEYGHRLHEDGITAVHDAACHPAAEAMYRRLETAGRLPVGVLVMPHSQAILMNDIGDRLHGPKTGEGSEQLRVGPVKFFADGGVAIALDVTIDGHRLQYGTLMADLEAKMTEAIAHGFRVGVHAMGNAGVQATIDAFRAAASAHPDDDHRFRIEHAGLADARQCHELASLGGVAVVQPNFVNHVGENSMGARFGDVHWLPFRSLSDAGVPLAASSDHPCAPYPPLWGAQRGALRTTLSGMSFEPEEALPLEDWLYAFTAGAAYAGGQEHERGRLAPGLRADLVVLDGDLDPTNPPSVAQTWVGGTRVYGA